ncbi:hypothetical protein NNC19_09765 [Clostridium sp. SHJSY1]|uniref:hypothetical protein n=1 Tax=Clostridium sp. SHJSY1 TaxID=2942483 RepID=UPI002876DA8A|nr:hypothetical protein [Clostridium sp. SHJSY1]MDS0525964.1 hypothetical protein [Clostridium sp. SHJSY1]
MLSKYEKGQDKKSINKISIVIMIILIGTIALLGGYKALQAHFTPENALKKYCNYLADKKYKNAYKMLYNTDEDFLSEETFEGTYSDVDFSSYSIKDHENNGFNYEIQVNGDTYNAEVSENGKKFFMFPNYKIDAKSIAAKEWKFFAPTGTEIFINDKKINDDMIKSEDTIKDNQGPYKTQVSTYSIDNIFKGKYDISFKLNGADEIVKNDVQAGDKVLIQTKISKEFTEQLINQTKDLFKAYYNEGKNYEKFFSSTANVATSINSLASNTDKRYKFIGDKIAVEKETEIGDSSHAKLRIMYTIEGTEADQMNTLYFIKENDKWLISSIDKY